MYLDAFSHFEIECNRLFESKELDTARPDVRATLDEEVHSLAIYQSSIAPIKTRILALKNMSTIISPIKVIPTEILARVFFFSVDWRRAFDTSPFRQRFLINQVNAISGVCSYWRHVSLSTRTIWSYIDLDKMVHSDHICLWLDRAGSCPLNIVKAPRFIPQAHDNSHVPIFLSTFPRFQLLRSLSFQLYRETETWLSAWCNRGIPRTLTALALSATNAEFYRFPDPQKHPTKQRLNELLYFLDTVYLRGVSFNWELVGCQNLVDLSLLDLPVTTKSLQLILSSNPKLEYIYLRGRGFSGSSTPFMAPLLISLPQLHTLKLEEFTGKKIRHILSMIAPGKCGLFLKIGLNFSSNASDDFRSELRAFCARSQLKKLHCLSFRVLWEAVTLSPQLETIVLERLVLCEPFYSIIVLAFHNIGTASQRIQPRLPYLHTIIAINCAFADVEGLRRVVSNCPIRQIGMDRLCNINDTPVSDIEEFKSWIGLQVNANFICDKMDMGFAPFGSH